jgi:hypothetical protein
VWLLSFLGPLLLIPRISFPARSSLAAALTGNRLESHGRGIRWLPTGGRATLGQLLSRRVHILTPRIRLCILLADATQLDTARISVVDLHHRGVDRRRYAVLATIAHRRWSSSRRVTGEGHRAILSGDRYEEIACIG